MSTPHRQLSLKFMVAAGALTGLLAITVAEWSPSPVRAADDGAGNIWQAPARAARKKNPIAADDKSFAAGKTVFVKECVSCHGAGGKGDGPAASTLNPKPNDLTNPKIWEQTDGALYWKITEGKKPMPSYEKLISEDDRWNVVNYMRSAFAPKQ